MRNNTAIEVYLVGFWPDYEAFFFQGIVVPNYRVKVINPIKAQRNNFLFKFLPRFLKNRLYKKQILSLIKKKNNDIFIFQDNRLFLDLIVRVDTHKRLNILYRNVLKNTEIEILRTKKLSEKGIHLWSFDVDDCNNYKMQFYQQFIRKHTGMSLPKPTYDFSFVGRDKGRSKKIYALEKKLNALGMTIFIKIIDSQKSSAMSYREYLRLSCQGKCIIDLNQGGQSGLTLRPLESILYKRKLLTNNTRVKSESFFSPENMKVHDLNDVDGFSLFISKPYEEVEFDEKGIHHPSVVLRSIIEFNVTQNFNQ